MTTLKRILLAEDNENDVELTMTALGENNLANEVVVVRDGAEAWDFLCRQGAFARGKSPGPRVLVSVLPRRADAGMARRPAYCAPRRYCIRTERRSESSSADLDPDPESRKEPP